VGAIWLVGLLIIRVPWAPFWALLGGMFQFVPNLGPVFALIGPAITATITGGLERLVYVLILYALIAVTDGFLLQPYFMKRTAKVPILASIFFPVVLGIFFSFWGVRTGNYWINWVGSKKPGSRSKSHAALTPFRS